MAHTLIQIQSHLFIISQSYVSFQFFIFKESSYMVFTSTYHYFFIQSHILRLQMGSTTFKVPSHHNELKEQPWTNWKSLNTHNFPLQKKEKPYGAHQQTSLLTYSNVMLFFQTALTT